MAWNSTANHRETYGKSSMAWNSTAKHREAYGKSAMAWNSTANRHGSQHGRASSSTAPQHRRLHPPKGSNPCTTSSLWTPVILGVVPHPSRGFAGENGVRIYMCSSRSVTCAHFPMLHGDTAFYLPKSLPFSQACKFAATGSVVSCNHAWLAFALCNSPVPMRYSSAYR